MSRTPHPVSLAVGMGGGVICGLVSLRSPAPPIMAFIGFPGMRAGEAALQWPNGHGDAVSSARQLKSFLMSRVCGPGAKHPPSNPET